MGSVVPAAAACSRCGKTTHASDDCPFGDGGAVLDEPAARDPEELIPGSLVGDYQIEATIGYGGMGKVYRAVHPLIGKRVAVKVLNGALASNENSVKRFALEARAVNEIRHRNLVDIFTFGRLPDGRWYHVMEYLEGQSLGDRLHLSGRLPAGEALPIFIEVTKALEAAHAKGIVHRDLKPDNVFLVAGGEGGNPTVKLLDFGIAKLMEGHTQLSGPRTMHGSTLGTPHYMSPEQTRGQSLDGRSDIYSLGVLLYQTVTGELPFDGPDGLAVCRKHVMEMPIRPLERTPGAVTVDLDRVIMRMLAKHVDQRYRTAAEVRVALAALASVDAARSF
jgi:serine/threonine-protein kinase